MQFLVILCFSPPCVRPGGVVRFSSSFFGKPLASLAAEIAVTQTMAMLLMIAGGWVGGWVARQQKTTRKITTTQVSAQPCVDGRAAAAAQDLHRAGRGGHGAAGQAARGSAPLEVPVRTVLELPAHVHKAHHPNHCCFDVTVDTGFN